MSPFDMNIVNAGVRPGPIAAREPGNMPGPAKSATVASPQIGKGDGVRVETTATPRNDAPFDADRVGLIRDALKAGTYPIQPAQIADAMIAGRLLLSIS